MAVEYCTRCGLGLLVDDDGDRTCPICGFTVYLHLHDASPANEVRGVTHSRSFERALAEYQFQTMRAIENQCCATCGVSTLRPSGRVAMFCSSLCRSRMYYPIAYHRKRIRRARERYGRRCAQCGIGLDPDMKSTAKYCGERCQSLSRRSVVNSRRRRRREKEGRLKKRGRICDLCGRKIPIEKNMNAKFCSTDCQMEAINVRREEERTPLKAGRVCAGCKADIHMSKRLTARYCSEKCGKITRNRNDRLKRKVRHGS